MGLKRREVCVDISNDRAQTGILHYNASHLSSQE